VSELSQLRRLSRKKYHAPYVCNTPVRKRGVVGSNRRYRNVGRDLGYDLVWKINRICIQCRRAGASKKTLNGRPASARISTVFEVELLCTSPHVRVRSRGRETIQASTLHLHPLHCNLVRFRHNPTDKFAFRTLVHLTCTLVHF
jgi:hypothetical protein